MYSTIRSLRMWLWNGAFIAGGIALVVGWASGFGVTVNTAVVLSIYLIVAMYCRGMNPLSFGKHARLAMLAESALLFTIIGALGAILSYIAMFHSEGFTDELLARSDEALGFSWPAIYEAVEERAWISVILECAYFSCFFMPFILFWLLYQSHSIEHLYRYLLAHGLTLAITVAMFLFFPARAAFAYYLGPHADTPTNVEHYTAIISGLRDGSLMNLDVFDLGGIMTFPSFHASMAILFTWGAWPNRRGRTSILIINILMWLAAVPVGGHYIVDLFGGSVVAFAAIGIVNRIGKVSGSNQGDDHFSNGADVDTPIPI